MAKPPSRIRRIKDASPKSILADRHSGGAFGGMSQLESVAKRSTSQRGAGSPVGGGGGGGIAQSLASNDVSPYNGRTEFDSWSGWQVVTPHIATFHISSGLNYPDGEFALFWGSSCLARIWAPAGVGLELAVPFMMGGPVPGPGTGWLGHPQPTGYNGLSLTIIYES